MIFKLILLSMVVSSAEANICDGYRQKASFLKIRERVDSKISNFSNDKIVAKKADEILSQLIKAKSPVITKWLKKHGSGKSEEQIVRDWRSYYGEKLLLSKYPQGEPLVDRKIEELIDSIFKENISDKFQQRVKVLFDRSKDASLNYIRSSQIDESSKEQIVKRIGAVSLYWPKKLKTSRNNSNPQDIINWGIAYDPKHNCINMGINSLSYPNDETYMAVFIHELGHSIDSCRWGAFFKGKWPFKKVGECLRSDASVGAKRRDDSHLLKMKKMGRLSTFDVAGLQLHPTCNRSIYPPPGVQADQLPEAFADWFSAEVTAKMDSLDLSKIRIDLCSSKKLSAGSSYPKNNERLFKIYYAHPELKKKALSLRQKSVKYCRL